MWTTIVTTIAIPLAFGATGWGLVLAQKYVDANVKDKRLKQWADGALSAAGKAYIILTDLRRANPTTPLPQLVQRAVAQTAGKFYEGYQPAVGSKIGASQDDAESRVKGELGVLLAADPTVSLEPSATVKLTEVPRTGTQV